MLLVNVRTRGFTLIEVLIVISIMLLVLAISVQGFSSFSIGAGNDTSARQVLRALEEAHARTLSADGGVQYGVHFASTSVTVFAGGTYISGDTNNVVYVLRKAEITNMSLSGGASDVVFARLRGNASATGTVTVTQTRDTLLAKTITINNTGLAEIQ